MASQNINIKIGDKAVSLSVDSKLEAYFRQAGEMLNGSLKSYMQQFKIQDINLLLRYAALSLLAEKLYNEDHSAHKQQGLEKQLDKLHLFADEILED